MKNIKCLFMSTLLLSSSLISSGNSASSSKNHNNNNENTTQEKLNADFYEAAGENNLEKLKELLEQGADINSKHSSNIHTALTFACYKGYPEIVKFLIEKKADINSQDDHDETALMITIYSDHGNGEDKYKIITKLLIDAGADIYIKSRRYIINQGLGGTPLMLANEYSDKYMYKLLKAAQEKDIKEITEAILNDDKNKIVKFIIKHPNFIDFNGNTALHLAAQKNKALAFNVIWNYKPEFFNKVNHKYQTATDTYPEIILHLINSKKLSLRNKTEDKDINGKLEEK